MTYTLVQASYFIAAVVFILGLKGMSSPVTARQGIVWAGYAMILATLVTFLYPTVTGFGNYTLIVIAIVVGGAVAWWSGKRVAMTDMPQMVALYNGMGGGSAAAIAAVYLIQAQFAVSAAGEGSIATEMGAAKASLALLGGLIGTVAFSGSLIAWAKLDGRMKRSQFLPMQHLVYIAVFVGTIAAGIAAYFSGSMTLVVLFFALALLLGVFMTVPIGGADMPVIISLFNALTGLAVGFKGYVLDIPALIIAGTVVGAAGMLLTQLMAKAMNRPISNVMFGAFGAASAGGAEAGPEGEMKEQQPEDAGITMAYSEQVVIVPGYGMAVAQAQHKVWELVELLEERGVRVKFAIHPVAGRMPGHMNVLLAEAGVPYDKIFDMEDINSDFPKTTVSLVIGANDVVNPAARKDPNSPIFGMPILNVDESENILVIKRGRGTGFSGVENGLFFDDKTRMLFGDAQEVVSKLIQTVKTL
ncbi:NAD(P) transhydrogenase subunit beta [Alkalilimnicola ehrlichii]|uniref:NAD(P) transhydrogenase subunit beta n=1 Tax=Alkalilimnicola ehrlichii TaxID=351052 RepID=A0A3E0X4Z5_9GAMM|nr:NAD(P)(+) transhydrogenase (Re/Si-specific) subunit beta [Alkalilimnicola ehrlichii]RFA31107.1 NAD(P) transhydrogenase subunit beta [Alkalilimnicola ehrlichii]RFA39606.1 NAD(P) transhydrogenase subunit beta [Alkalilimnicola ehrlichii]